MVTATLKRQEKNRKDAIASWLPRPRNNRYDILEVQAFFSRFVVEFFAQNDLGRFCGDFVVIRLARACSGSISIERLDPLFGIIK